MLAANEEEKVEHYATLQQLREWNSLHGREDLNEQIDFEEWWAEVNGWRDFLD